MYLSELKLWNFRKFGGGGDIITNGNKIRKADLEVPFQNGLNVLIGENDSGKTAIIDAVKLVLKTHSTEWIRVDFEDFYDTAKQLRIECIFRGFEGKDNEAMHFTEWLGMEGEGKSAEPYLRLIMDIQHNGDRVLPFEVRAGVDDLGSPLTAEAREYLKATYLKPLRDAQQELIPKRHSRLSQILEGHEVFKGKADNHELKAISRCFNCLMQKYFDRDYRDKECTEADCPIKDRFLSNAGSEKNIRVDLNTYVQKFLGEIESKAKFGVISPKLKNILEGLKLSFDMAFDPGLGSQNLLFIAAELLNLDRSNWSGLRLGLIEELEAHLHPQAQMRVVEYFQSFVEKRREEKKDIQFILTTHSPNLGSKIDLKSLIICFEKQVFPMGDKYTELEGGDYGFLQRFLDVTKANLFFAKGVILVEGWAEELLIPALAKKIGIDLTQKGVSVVNVAGTPFLRYAKIFRRKDEKEMGIPVSVVTDLDLKPDDENQQENGKSKKAIAMESKALKYNGQSVKTFVSPNWTLEYCIALSDLLKKLFYNAVLLAFKEQKNYQEKEKIKTIDEAIKKIDEQFSSWTEDDIALKIYNQILGETQVLGLCKEIISKSLIAQHFADILQKDNTITSKSLTADANIEYLIDAIKYAAREGINDTSN